jgi:hypothetical protein
VANCMIAMVSIVRATNKYVDLRPQLRITSSGCTTGAAGSDAVMFGAFESICVQMCVQKRKKAGSKRAMSERRAPPRGLSVCKTPPDSSSFSLQPSSSSFPLYSTFAYSSRAFSSFTTYLIQLLISCHHSCSQKKAIYFFKKL